MRLCTFSKSEILHDLILSVCPLALKSSEAAKCPCRKREYNVPPADLRVLTCTHPNDWRGDRLGDDAEVVAVIRSKIAREREAAGKRSPKARKPSPKPATTTDAPEENMSTAPAAEKAPMESPRTGNALVPISQTTNANEFYSKITDAMSYVNNVGIAMYQSRMFNLANESQGRMLALTCYCRQMDPFEFKRRHHVVGGEVSLKADAMLADFADLGGQYEVIERSPTRAAIRLRSGGREYLSEFTWEECAIEDYVYTKACLDGKVKKGAPESFKDNYKTPRRRMQMLWARVVSDGVRVVEPRVNCGRYTPEELGAEMFIDADFAPVAASASAPVASQVDEAAASSPATAPTEVVVDAEFEPAKPEMNPETAAAATTESPKPEPAKTQEAERPAANLRDDRPLSDDKVELLKEVVDLRDRMKWSNERFAELKKTYNVASLRDLDVATIQSIVVSMRRECDDMAKRSELNDWANSVTGKK